MSQVFTYDAVTLTELIESKPCLWDKTRGCFQRGCKSFLPNILQPQIIYRANIGYIQYCLSRFFVFLPTIQEHKQVALPISMHKHVSCAALSDWSKYITD
jgi:hypothetical protein